MTQSIVSTATQTAGLTRSTRKKRGSCVMKAQSKSLSKKLRGGSSLSETSPQRPSRSEDVRWLTQESKRNEPNSCFTGLEFGSDAVANTTGLPVAQMVGVMQDWKAGLTAPEEVPIKAMLLQSQNLAEAILIGYQKEREKIALQNSKIVAEMTGLRDFKKEAAKEIEELRAVKAGIEKREAAASEKLEKQQNECARRDELTALAALVISKAVVMREKALSNASFRGKIKKLHLENQNLLHEKIDADVAWRLELDKLRSALGSVEKELAETQSGKLELLREREEMEVSAELVSEELRSQLRNAHAEAQQLHLDLESFMINYKNHIESGAAHVAAAQLDKLRSENKAVVDEMQETIRKQAEKCASVEAQLSSLLLEKAKIVKGKLDFESAANSKIAQLISKNNALIKEKEKIQAISSQTDSSQLQSLHSVLKDSVKQFQAWKKTAAVEAENLRSQQAEKNMELAVLISKLTDFVAEAGSVDALATARAEIQRLTLEKEESDAREAATLRNLQSMMIVPGGAHSQMHLAFLINCGLIKLDK